MPEAWKEWEGRVVNREFRLGNYLGGSEHARVFLTQYGPELRKAAVKLIPIGTWDEATVEAELARLQRAGELSHPHLLQIFQVGRTTLEDTELLFVVMEYAEEDLSQILPKRALTAAETREMLKPILDALGYVHRKGLVLGHLTPANVMAIGDDVKLASDGISRSGERRVVAGESSDYDAPEIAGGESSPARSIPTRATSLEGADARDRGGRVGDPDVWSLGMLLVTALTQRLPGRETSGEDPTVPENVPALFDEIARQCLRRDASARWSVAEIAARLGFESLPEPAAATQAMRPSAAAPRAAAGPQLAVAKRRAAPAPREFRYRDRSNTGAYVAGAVVLLIVVIFGLTRMFRGASGTSAVEQSRPTQTRAAANSGMARVSADGAASRAANLQPGAEKAEGLSETREKTQRRRVTAGQVAEQVVPDVPQSARDTIHGTVRVGVRISVDSAGNVTEAELETPGPSKYFAHLALEAAQQWRFEPPKVAGRNVLSDWLLHFQFREEGTKVIPVQSDP